MNRPKALQMSVMAMSLRLAVESVVLNPWRDLGFLEYKPSVDQVRSQVRSTAASEQWCSAAGSVRIDAHLPLSSTHRLNLLFAYEGQTVSLMAKARQPCLFASNLLRLLLNRSMPATD